MSTKRAPKRTKAIRFICGPVRAVARAWDSYLKSMAGLSWPVAYGNTMGCPVPTFSRLEPSRKTVDEELQDVIRLATDRRLIGNPAVVGHCPKKSVVPLGCGADRLDRIDEGAEF